MKTTITIRRRRMTVLFCLVGFLGTKALQAQAPVITSFTPASGSVGTLVTVSGTNFSSPTSFTIGGVNAIVVSNTGNNLVGMVMPGSVTGGVVVSTAGGTANGSSNFTVTPTSFPSVQQGGKLVGTGAIGTPARQGTSVSISADGNTAIVGGTNDDSVQGAAWIYTFSGTTWIQQGPKLVGTGNIGAAGQGSSVSLSADGNTAIVGGNLDNSGIGASWVFVRNGGIWTQQGAKLVGSGNSGPSFQGVSVSLSADGNTAIVGGYTDNATQGAAWIFIRNGSSWTQQGVKLVGTGGSTFAGQGLSVSISADGNTAIVGGYFDNSGQGAAWVFIRNGVTWVQQGGKLVGTGNIGAASQGYPVSLSADGNIALLGGSTDNSNVGAIWVFTRSGGNWTQQGTKLVGTGNIGPALQGSSVSLSADGNTIIEGGPFDNSNIGAAWVFTRNGNTWSQKGAKLVGTGSVGDTIYQGQSVSLSANGNMAIVGGWWDNSNMGAAWVFGSSTLPVKLISFTGERQASNNLLHWSTASEQNNKGFELQRSADGENFSKVSFVNSKAVKGNSTGMLAYSFTDEKPVSGSNFYRLKQVDYDGKSKLSNVVLIKGETVSESMIVELFPNPGSSRFTLIINSSNPQPVSIRVTDAVGNIVYQSKGNSAQPFRFGEKFSNGTYLVEVRQGDVVKTVKAVKMK